MERERIPAGESPRGLSASQRATCAVRWLSAGRIEDDDDDLGFRAPQQSCYMAPIGRIEAERSALLGQLDGDRSAVGAESPATVWRRSNSPSVGGYPRHLCAFGGFFFSRRLCAFGELSRRLGAFGWCSPPPCAFGGFFPAAVRDRRIPQRLAALGGLSPALVCFRRIFPAARHVRRISPAPVCVRRIPSGWPRSEDFSPAPVCVRRISRRLGTFEGYPRHLCAFGGFPAVGRAQRIFPGTCVRSEDFPGG